MKKALLTTNRHQQLRSRFRVAVCKILIAILATTCSDGLAAEPSTTENKDSSNNPTHDRSGVRVMSFNIRYGKAEDGPNHWRHRKELVLKTVRQFDPDVLGVQEMMGFQADFFRQNLPEYEHHGTSRVPSDADQEQCALFFRKSRFEKTQSGHFWLSETPDVPGSQSWDSSLPRMVSWTKIRERARPESDFFVFNTHFDHRGREARLQSAALLRVRIEEIAEAAPILLTGDFNADEASLPQQVLLYSTKGLGLSDTYRSHNPKRDPNGESTSTRWNGNRAGRRIDWILASPHWRVSAAAIDDTNDQGRYPSDHYPVNAVLKLTPPPLKQQ
jgi:endonuclease/exonuclease/phosphatase family metal-dependent hydrolase